MFVALRPYVKKSLSSEYYFSFLDHKLKKNIKENEVLKSHHIKWKFYLLPITLKNQDLEIT